MANLIAVICANCCIYNQFRIGWQYANNTHMSTVASPCLHPSPAPTVYHPCIAYMGDHWWCVGHVWGLKYGCTHTAPIKIPYMGGHGCSMGGLWGPWVQSGAPWVRIVFSEGSAPSGTAQLCKDDNSNDRCLCQVFSLRPRLVAVEGNQHRAVVVMHSLQQTHAQCPSRQFYCTNPGLWKLLYAR